MIELLLKLKMAKIALLGMLAVLHPATFGAVSTTTPIVIAPYAMTVAEERANVSYPDMVSKKFVGYHSGTKGLTYEITKVDTFPRGVEIFARAWLNGKQLGFGTDFTTDIERFRFYEPDGMVPDANGDIIQNLKDHTNRFKYDPLRSLLDDLEHTMSLVGKTDTKIVAGSIGHTTSTYNSQTGGGGANTTVDGSLEVDGVVSWAASRALTNSDTANVSQIQDYIFSRNLNGPTIAIYKHIYTFDTSDIGTDSISSAVFSFITASAGDQNSDAVDIVGATPANANNLAVGDYSQLGSTVFGSILLANVNTNGSTYNDITLTDTSGITKNSVTKLGGLMESVRANTAPSANTQDYVNIKLADNGSLVPKLVIVHAAAAAVPKVVPKPVPIFFM